MDNEKIAKFIYNLRKKNKLTQKKSKENCNVEWNQIEVVCLKKEQSCM